MVEQKKKLTKIKRLTYVHVHGFMSLCLYIIYKIKKKIKKIEKSVKMFDKTLLTITITTVH